MEGTGTQDYHDRYFDGIAVVHLRLREGVLPLATPTPTRNARIPQAQASSAARELGHHRATTKTLKS